MRRSLNIATCSETGYEEERDKFLSTRIKDLRCVLILFNISNMIFQVQALMKPLSQKHYDFNIAYCINSFVSILILAVTYKNERYLKLVILNSVIYQIRNSFRIFDFENTKEHYEPENFLWLMLMQMVTNFMVIYLTHCSMPLSWKSASLTITCSIFANMCFFVGNNNLKFENEGIGAWLNLLKNCLILLITWLYFLYLANKSSVFLFDEMISRV